MVKISKIFFIFLITVIIALAIIVFIWFFAPMYSPNVQERNKNGITWGIDFSQSQAEYLQLDWKKAYLAIINDLKARNIKLHTNWNWVEGEKDKFFFDDIDWQIKQAERNKVKIIYVIGMKTGRWPECHIPSFAENLPKEQQQEELLKYVSEVVSRYKNSKSILYWQIENEPFLKFGVCPSWYYHDDAFLKSEIDLIKIIDPSRKIVVSESGELSSWNKAASVADIVGITMYRNSWPAENLTFGINPYSFLSPQIYADKAALIKKSFGKNIICVELQAEPWAGKPLMESSLQDQFVSMNPKLFLENIQFARQTGLRTFYFWGSEWWYWLKEKQSKPEIWNEAKNLFANRN